MPTPFTRNEIPFTAARLKSLIKVYCTYGGYTPDPNDPTNLPSLGSLNLVGSVTTIELKNPRQAAERRELNYDNFAEILEMIPGLDSFELNFKAVALYRQTFAEACGIGGFGVRFNTRPLLFAFRLPSPNPGALPPVTLLARGCLLLDNPLGFDVEAKDDLRIIQDIPVACAGIIEIPGA
jgi:hypothetical protein